MFLKDSKNLLCLIMLLLPFFKQSDASFTSIKIPKEIFPSILHDLPKSKTIPITGEEWAPKEKARNFGGWAISKTLFDFIRLILPEGKTLLELGSGWGSGQFSQYYTVYSIEHSPKWLGKYNTNYIYVPIKGKWYNPAILKEKLPENYDLILVDGPPGFIGRHGFCTYLNLFKTDLTIVFDDVHRKAEYQLMIQVGEKLQRDVEVFNSTHSHKKFGVILYESIT